MTRSTLYLGPAPAGETPVQPGELDYRLNAKQECRRYIESIRKVCGREPRGARLSIQSEWRDFGRYYQVVCYFYEDRRAAVEYAAKCEKHAPRTWQEAGMASPGFDADWGQE